MRFGNKMKLKEFFRRWGQGIQQITPMQQVKISLIGNVLIIIGVLIGLYATATSKVWWLFVILCGSFFLTMIGLLGNLQKYFALSKLNKEMGGLKNEERTI